MSSPMRIAHWFHRDRRLLRRSAALLMAGVSACALAGQVDIPGPADSVSFGASVLALSNGNFVVSDPMWTGPALNAGAVYLYDADGTLISTLTGSHSHDQVGEQLREVGNGNFAVISSNWNDGRGAVTWVNGTTGFSGSVSSANSLVGSVAGDYVGDGGVVGVGDHHFVVCSLAWSNGNLWRVGAVTWCNGASGCQGPVSTQNSLYGGTASDYVGSDINVLSNGNYVVKSVSWDVPGGAANAGAITWASGNAGRTGLVSAANSLVGNHTGDIDYSNVVPLRNGHYVVGMPYWDNGNVPDVGAAVWGNGDTGVAGPVSAANALVGAKQDDRVGYGVTALSNGHYVVQSPFLDAGALQDVGAITWGNGNTGRIGVVSVLNSLTGAGDLKGPEYVYPLTNGNYVVVSPHWDAGGVAQELGAVTWVDGSGPVSGSVSAANSLIGSSMYDSIGTNVIALSNGNYVVASPYWDGVAQATGAVTWANGNTGLTGVLSAANSLVGSTYGDRVGLNLHALSNGNYIVNSYFWNAPGAVAAGAVTWGNGATGLVGTVSAANSLVGASAYDMIGGKYDMDGWDHPNVITLSNGNYVVSSVRADIDGHVDAGAVTWGNGAAGTVGAVDKSNSLYGSSDHGEISDYLIAQRDGNYVFPSFAWSNGALAYVGAVTLGNGTAPTPGPISPVNSVLGTVQG